MYAANVAASQDSDFVRRLCGDDGRAFAAVFAAELGVNDPSAIEAAFARTAARLTSAGGGSRSVGHDTAQDAFALRFVHKCRFLGCIDSACELCRNNPQKACAEGLDFDEICAEKQTMKARCGDEVSVHLVSLTTGLPVDMPSVEVQLSIVCWESDPILELLRSDAGEALLAARSTSSKWEADGHGRLLVPLVSGRACLPDLYATDKNETFKSNGRKFSSFRLLAAAVSRSASGEVLRQERVAPALSSAFSIKTQRALNDYRKAEYPHCSDMLTKLKYIGKDTAEKLKVVKKQHMPSVPDELASVRTVEELRQLMAYADRHREVENQLQEVLGMKGRHEHKWKHLRSVLDRTVYDDARYRVWYADSARTTGLVFKAARGQVGLSKPEGLPKAVAQADGLQCLHVLPAVDASQLHRLREAAEAAWYQPGHRGWEVVRGPVVEHSQAAQAAAATANSSISGPTTAASAVVHTQGAVSTHPPWQPESRAGAPPDMAAAAAAAVACDGTGCEPPRWTPPPHLERCVAGQQLRPDLMPPLPPVFAAPAATSPGAALAASDAAVSSAAGLAVLQPSPPSTPFLDMFDAYPSVAADAFLAQDIAERLTNGGGGGGGGIPGFGMRGGNADTRAGTGGAAPRGHLAMASEPLPTSFRHPIQPTASGDVRAKRTRATPAPAALTSSFISCAVPPDVCAAFGMFDDDEFEHGFEHGSERGGSGDGGAESAVSTHERTDAAARGHHPLEGPSLWDPSGSGFRHYPRRREASCHQHAAAVRASAAAGHVLPGGAPPALLVPFDVGPSGQPEGSPVGQLTGSLQQVSLKDGRHSRAAALAALAASQQDTACNVGGGAGGSAGGCAGCSAAGGVDGGSTFDAEAPPVEVGMLDMPADSLLASLLPNSLNGSGILSANFPSLQPN